MIARKTVDVYYTYHLPGDKEDSNSGDYIAVLQIIL